MRSSRSGFATCGGTAIRTDANTPGLATRSNGFRIDHAFLSQELAARAGTIHYSHEERIAGLSVRSALILELAA